MKNHDRATGGALKASLDQRLAAVVRVEMYVAAFTMAAGLVVALLKGLPGGATFALEGLLPRLLRGDGAAIASFGILLLLIVPVTFVVFACTFFIRRREPLFAVASAVVLLLLIAGALSGLD